MTTNSFNELNILLNRIERQDKNIRIIRSIGSTIEFLDVVVENNNGQLRTSVYHKPATEPYILPYSDDHPRHVHRSTIKSQLFRAIRLYSHLEDFDQERLQIEFRLLLNGFPPKFIVYSFKNFFQQHNASCLLQYLDEALYKKLY